MSIKFRADGAVFPTTVRDGNLIIHMGDVEVATPFKFLTEDFMYDNIDFPMCNVMCFLKNANRSIVMRFDGTVTSFDKDMTVTGFCKFDKEDIYSKIQHIPVGIVGHGKSKIDTHTKCTIYPIPDTKLFILECVGDPEPIIFSPDDNPLFVKDILSGNRYYPRLVKDSTNLYREDDGRYYITGRAIKTTGFINM